MSITVRLTFDTPADARALGEHLVAENRFNWVGQSVLKQVPESTSVYADFTMYDEKGVQVGLPVQRRVDLMVSNGFGVIGKVEVQVLGLGKRERRNVADVKMLLPGADKALSVMGNQIVGVMEGDSIVLNF